MKMVAAARFGRAQKEMAESARFPAEIEKILFYAVRMKKAEWKQSRCIDTGVRSSFGSSRLGIVLITGDKGLCGDFNSNAARHCSKLLKEKAGSVHALFAIGKKSIDFAKKSGVRKRLDFPGVFSDLSFDSASKIGQSILETFNTNELTELTVVYNSFVSAARYTPSVVTVAPLNVGGHATAEEVSMDCEPLELDGDALFSLWFRSKLYFFMRSSCAAELAARITAMSNATKNAGTLIDKLTLDMNKARQAIITREIAEIVGTSEVLKE
jgi:F-type H+-transporting ATPase subunit gamma